MPTLLSRLRRLSACLFLCIIAAVSIAAQEPKPSPTPEKPKSVVRGRVLYDDTNDPVRRSGVMLVQLTHDSASLSAATDREGKFEIYEVPPGVYFVLVDSPGIISPVSFLRASENSRQPESFDIKAMHEYCTEVAVDGTHNLNITVRARRGGVISGKVSYSDSAPAVNAVLSLFKQNGKERIRMVNTINISGVFSLQTDDRGRYRISGLPPGNYFVAAAEKNTSPTRVRRGYDPLSAMFSDALSASYWGNTGKLSDALAIEIGAGSEINDIDIVLSDSTPHAISGTVVAKSDGHPLSGAAIAIKNKEQTDWLSRDPQTVTSDSDGKWSFDGIPDGAYSIRVEPSSEPDQLVAMDEDVADQKSAPKKNRLLPKQIDALVAGADVGGLAIELTEGASVSGTVQIPPSQSQNVYTLIHYAYESGAPVSVGRMGLRLNSGSSVASNGKFTIEPLESGKIYLSAEVNGYARADESVKYYVKSITLNGSDLMKTPLTLEAGQRITNVTIVLAADAAQARIQLLDGTGKPIPAKALAVFPIDQSKWSFDSQRTIGVTDADGIVPFSGAPGDYLVIVAGKDDAWPPSIEGVQAAAGAARRISLSPGDNKIVTVTAN